MKGIIFTEFLEMVEARHGLDMVDHLIDSANLESRGIYTSVGTYNHEELIALINVLSLAISVPASNLIRDFGFQLFNRLSTVYAVFLKDMPTATAFLWTIENHIHVEVLKLYPDAELPQFECCDLDQGGMELTYYSKRPLADLAEGLLLGCIAYFREPFDLQRIDLPIENGTAVRFTLSPKGGFA